MNILNTFYTRSLPLSAIAVMASLAGLGSSANAAVTLVSNSFSAVTSGAVSTSGAADWGYLSVNTSQNNGLFNGSAGDYSNLAFGSLDRPDAAVITSVSGASTIGAVTMTELRTNLGGQANASPFTFGGNTTYGSYGGFGGTNDNIWTMNFNDLGIGTFTISLYMGHNQSNRNFEMDVSGTGLTGFSHRVSDQSGVSTIGDLGSTVAFSSGNAFTYDITVTTTSATDDLALTFGSRAGSSGGALLAGYTVVAVPEPSSTALLGLGGLALILRRRRI